MYGLTLFPVTGRDAKPKDYLRWYNNTSKSLDMYSKDKKKVSEFISSEVAYRAGMGCRKYK
jgi:hypothetical protein